MSIKIGERFRPFSHLPGQSFCLPFSIHSIQVFPAAILLLNTHQLIPLAVDGFVEDFTVILDLERGGVKVFGVSPKGYFRYWIFGRGEQLYFVQEKGSHNLLEDSSQFILSEPPPVLDRSMERLSFGVTKKQDWELMRRRNILLEFLPLWFMLGQQVESIEAKTQEDCLLFDLVQSIERHETLNIPPLFSLLFELGFSGVLFPSMHDSLHRGFQRPLLDEKSRPQKLLYQGYQLIRSLIVKLESTTCIIAPQATSLFASGKMTDIQLPFGKMDMEWTKYFLRKVNFRAQNSCSIQFLFPKTVKKCRLTYQGKIHFLNLNSNTSLDIESNTPYFFDHFE